MDMMLDLSLYPINAMAYADSTRSIQSNRDWQTTDRVNQVDALSPVRTNVWDEDNASARRRDNWQATRREPAATRGSTRAQSQYPLSSREVHARYG